MKELCEAAGINRGTFYSHYTDPIDLYHEMELALIQELHSVLDAFSETNADYEEIITEIFRYVADNKEQYMLFFLFCQGKRCRKQAISSVAYEIFAVTLDSKGDV